ncbi:MAG: type III secretion system gatekeeper subunit SctW [Verrucomicrobia bacterium]|nr:type III secretion system gatekeeper subunit SctW [Verrucomicrobiota bacterium]
MSTPHLPNVTPISVQSARMAQQIARDELMEQVESESDLQNWMDNAFNPVAMMRNFRTLEEQKAQQARKGEEKSEVKETKILRVEEISEIADKFQRQNDELQSRTLLILRSRIKPGDSPDEVLRKVLETYPDHALADEALDFLIETSEGEIQKTAQVAKERLNKTFEREIKAGRNMGTQAREFSKEGLGSPTSLRDLYRDITGQAREPLRLFEELTEKFPYDKLKPAITFLLHSLGADLKSKGPSIPRPELKRLFDDTRSLQGILGVFRFFQSRMRLVARQFASYNLVLPTRLNFELISKHFVKLLAERYINADKILQTARLLGISDETAAQIIIFMQMRDAIKQVSPRYFRNPQHVMELTRAMLEALEKLEDQLEEEEEKEEKREKEKND